MWPGTLVHHLHVVLPCDAREFALRLQLSELRLVVGVGNRAGSESIAEREGDIVCRA